MASAPGESLIGKFLVLRGAARELWLILAAKVLTITAYALVGTSTLGLWLSADLKLSDEGAGLVIAGWSSALTIFTVMVGSLVDAIGIRRSLLIGFGLCVLARTTLSFATSPWLALLLGLLPLALGEALQTPVMVAAVKRFSTTRQRSIAYSIYYSMMNVGFAVAAWTFDRVRAGLGEQGSLTLPGIGVTISTYQTIMLLGLGFTLPNLLITYFGLREGVEATETGVRVTEVPSPYPGVGLPRAFVLSCRDALRDWLRIFGRLWTQPAFYRFLAFFGLVVFVKLILYHMYYTFPKFGLRELGPGAPIGHVFGLLNATIVIVLAPLVGALTQRVSAYRAVVIGTAIAAGSVFFLAVPPVHFAWLADGWLGELVGHTWLGLPGPVPPLLVAIVLCVVVYSVGEACYSPRLYEYPAAIAPRGQEGSYLALSLLPYFFAKFVVGSLSGFLLARWCPAEGPRQSHLIWLVVGGMAVLTPLGLVAFRRWLQLPESGRE